LGETQHLKSLHLGHEAAFDAKAFLRYFLPTLVPYYGLGADTVLLLQVAAHLFESLAFRKRPHHVKVAFYTRVSLGVAAWLRDDMFWALRRHRLCACLHAFDVCAGSFANGIEFLYLSDLSKFRLFRLLIIQCVCF